MIDLFNTKPFKAKRVYRVETLNKDRGIVSSMSTKDGKNYVIVLCLPHKTIRTSFLNKRLALNKMSEYRNKYKE